MVLGKLRKQYKRAMMPIGRFLARTGLTPNMITGLTVLVALTSTYFFYAGSLLIGLAVMIFAIVLDMFDGAVARAADLATPFGATFDHTLDRYAEFLFLLGLMLGPAGSPGKYVPWFWGFFTLFGMIMASFSRAKAESVGGMDDCAVGLAERQEKLLLVMLGIILLAVPETNIWLQILAFFPPSASDFVISTLDIPNILAFFVVIVGILSHITVGQRLSYAKMQIEARSEPPSERS
ncbi:MAG: CDP-alcohol phosphatidyltransferase family protein [Candidatus Thorarchaeota archaeon]